jgi:hypothetical protein
MREEMNGSIERMSESLIKVDHSFPGLATHLGEAEFSTR